jgi:hypothetical protein
MRNKKLIFVTIIMALLIILSCVMVKICFLRYTGSLPEGISTVTLPKHNANFTNVIQNFDILLQNKTIVITKELIQSRYAHLLREIDSTLSGLMVQQKYIFYEDNIFQRTVLGSFDVFERYDKIEIHKLFHDGGALFFDIMREDSFQFSCLPQNNQLIIVHQIKSNKFELIDCYLSSKRPALSCDIIIYAGTYETSNGSEFTEKRLLRPVASCTKLKLILDK